MGAYDDVLAGCFSNDVKAVVEIVIVATTASTTKRRAVDDNIMDGRREIQKVKFNVPASTYYVISDCEFHDQSAQASALHLFRKELQF